MHSTIYARRPAQYSCFLHAVILSEPLHFWAGKFLGRLEPSFLVADAPPLRIKLRTMKNLFCQATGAALISCGSLVAALQMVESRGKRRNPNVFQETDPSSQYLYTQRRENGKV